jgi:hypothetical protein
MTDPAPVQLLLTGSCDNIGESWLLDYLTGYRFPHDEVEIVCEQQAPEMILTAMPVPEPGWWFLLAGVAVMALLSRNR